jgi:HK97 gp10 family phage protein
MADFNHIPQAIAGLKQAMHQGVVKGAFDIQAHAASTAAVDTGNLRNSIYTKTSDGNNYPGSASNSLVADQIPDVDEMTAYVAVAASYGVYIELGTRFMPAQPFLLPGANAVQPGFDAYFDHIEAAMRAAGV